MSVKSYDLKNITITPKLYHTPQFKMNQSGQITYIEDLSDNVNNLQATYDAYLAEYNVQDASFTEIETFITDTGASVVTQSDILIAQIATLNTQESDLVALNTSYVPFAYDEHFILASDTNTSSSWIFSNVDGNTNEQTPQLIATNMTIPAGTWLCSANLVGQAIGGDASKIPNSGSAMTIIVNVTGGASNLVAVFQSGRSTYTNEGDLDSVRSYGAGSKIVTFAAETNVDLRFYISAGAVVGQDSYEEVAIEWQVSPWCSIGASTVVPADGTPLLVPNIPYRALSFQKI
tara:strand:+ start:948 stop:1817 length:870 start_codon:yes stop_codon:yes gene_type:complete